MVEFIAVEISLKCWCQSSISMSVVC